MPDFLAIDENLRGAMQFFGRASGAGTVEPVDGGLAIYSGLDYGVFNIALVTSPVAEGELEKRLAAFAKFFRPRTLRWSVWICEDMLAPVVRRRERQIFLNFGMRPISQPPGMLAPSLNPPAHLLPDIEIRRVADKITRAAFAEITSVTFEIPYTIAHAVYSRETAWQGNYEGFVGFVGGRAVSIIAIVAAAGVTGVYSLGTMPEFRGKGYAEALLRKAVGEAKPVILQATEAGYQLYKRMGFRDVTKFTVYLTK